MEEELKKCLYRWSLGDSMTSLLIQYLEFNDVMDRDSFRQLTDERISEMFPPESELKKHFLQKFRSGMIKRRRVEDSVDVSLEHPKSSSPPNATDQRGEQRSKNLSTLSQSSSTPQSFISSQRSRLSQTSSPPQSLSQSQTPKRSQLSPNTTPKICHGISPHYSEAITAYYTKDYSQAISACLAKDCSQTTRTYHAEDNSSTCAST
ncbi:hypothetical protein QAD02_021755 [Eretmocerus hayati]|uniref:Uncharacterized protein n=1 Tax=Eretmocerus hayati TaxID=131215 RepID=A0ACC2PUA4_9HYME|nr:hypothetical protein QAD02_021755 [Eretmocerus hayati]